MIPLPFRNREEFKNKVVMIPGSGGIVKCWPAKQWVELASLLVEDGQEVLVVGKPEQSEIVKALVDRQLDYFPTPDMRDALDVISSSACVIAVDTGLMHLAVNQGISTIALFRYNTMFSRDYKHARSLVARMCDPMSIGGHGDVLWKMSKSVA